MRRCVVRLMPPRAQVRRVPHCKAVRPQSTCTQPTIASRTPDRSLPPLQRVELCCERAAAIEPRLRSLLPEADRKRRMVREVEVLERRALQGSDLPLYGMLLGVKDIMEAEGFPTRCGSGLPAEAFEDAADLRGENPAVSSARHAGALLVGKTATTEFANMETAATTNPWNATHTPGGSSQGSAAAVAAGLCDIAFGTQTGGSVNRRAPRAASRIL